MTLSRSFFALALTCWFVTAAVAAEYRIEALNEAPPTEGLSADIAKTLSGTGVRIMRGTTRTVCDIWLCKDWSVADKPEADAMYPFQPGQLIGVARYARKGSDFRDQDVEEGLYTLRFGLQPVDGAHVGTSPTRDFLALILAADDKSPALLSYDDLVAASSEAAGSSHPALLSLQAAQGDAKSPAIRHNEEHDWWIVRLQGTAKSGGQAKDMKLDLVVVGVAVE